MALCAVIPAAGRGTRLGAGCPKVLVELVPGISIWDVLARNLAPLVDCFNVIVSPESAPLFRRVLNEHPIGKRVLISLQPTPKGMGDAIFSGVDVWRESTDILVIWGDQVHVSHATLRNCIEAHFPSEPPHLTIPVVRSPRPYVEYIFSTDDTLMDINQSREGDICTANGWCDVGTFLLTARNLEDAWKEYLCTQPRAAFTGELNFLPFLVYLSQHKQWPVRRIVVDDPNEARGVNTQEDLTFFRELYAKLDLT
jgi:bifunctional UDP-N-acetylglucosamine pyrophosphorylase/glucosamine-1-phosphate N-acetyltransferase